MGRHESETMTAREQMEIRFSGSGGQGLQLSARLLAIALNRQGYFVAQSQAYEPTSRGGVSRSDLVVGPDTPDYPLATSLDYLIVLDQIAVPISQDLLKTDSRVISDSRLVPEPPKGDFTHHALPLTDTAISLGNRRVANIVALGALMGLGGLGEPELMEEVIRTGVPPKFRDLNLAAFAEGLAMTQTTTEPQLQAS